MKIFVCHSTLILGERNIKVSFSFGERNFGSNIHHKCSLLYFIVKKFICNSTLTLESKDISRISVTTILVHGSDIFPKYSWLHFQIQKKSFVLSVSLYDHKIFLVTLPNLKKFSVLSVSFYDHYFGRPTHCVFYNYDAAYTYKTILLLYVCEGHTLSISSYSCQFILSQPEKYLLLFVTHLQSDDLLSAWFEYSPKMSLVTLPNQKAFMSRICISS